MGTSLIGGGRHGHAQRCFGRHLLVHREHRYHPGHREAGARISHSDLDGRVAAGDFHHHRQGRAGDDGELLLNTGGTATTDVTELTTLSVDVVGDFSDVYRLTFTTSGAVKTDITVEGALAFDRLITGDGDDTLTGFDGNDVLKGNAGVDRLDGGADDDRLTGGANEDFFIFEGAFGQDVVLDFGTGVDKFDMDATLSFAALTITAVDSDADGAADDVRVATGADRFDVLNTNLAMIDAGDFLFSDDSAAPGEGGPCVPGAARARRIDCPQLAHERDLSSWFALRVGGADEGICQLFAQAKRLGAGRSGAGPGGGRCRGIGRLEGVRGRANRGRADGRHPGQGRTPSALPVRRLS